MQQRAEGSIEDDLVEWDGLQGILTFTGDVGIDAVTGFKRELRLVLTTVHWWG